MTLTDIGRDGVAALLTGVLVWAAANDVRTRKIPNASVLAVVVLFAGWTMLAGFSGLAQAMIAGAIAFVVSFALYNLKIVGAGDSKLFAAVALFAGLDRLAQLTLLTGIVGGLIALFIMVTRPRRALVMLTMRGKGDFGDGIPYGVAIAAAAIVVVWTDLYFPQLLSLP